MSFFNVRSWALFRNLFQIIALCAVVALAAASVTTTVFSALGVLPWLEVTAGLGNLAIPGAGMMLQIGFSVLCVALLFFVPASGRILTLEKAHRNFKISMDDVARAYQISHSADRSGEFTLSSEFDSVRDRMEYLREHPDLAELEPGLIEVAGQMSHVTRDLALTYSDEKVARARTFLRQRQEEVQDLRDRIRAATATCDELRRWIQDVKADERLAVKQISRLERDLAEILPEIGLEIVSISTGDEGSDANVVPLAGKPGDGAEATLAARTAPGARSLKAATKAARIAAQSATIAGEYHDSLSGPVIPSSSFAAHVVTPKPAN